jgi:hypothetical protein
VANLSFAVNRLKRVMARNRSIKRFSIEIVEHPVNADAWQCVGMAAQVEVKGKFSIPLGIVDIYPRAIPHHP